VKKLFKNDGLNKFNNGYLRIQWEQFCATLHFTGEKERKPISNQDNLFVANFHNSMCKKLNIEFYETGVFVSYVDGVNFGYSHFKFYNNDGKLIWQHSLNTQDKTAKNKQFYYSILDEGIFSFEQDGVKTTELKLTKYDGTLTNIKDNDLKYLYTTLNIPTGIQNADSEPNK